MSTAVTTQGASHPITAQILAQVKAIDVQLPESVEDKWAEIEQKEIALAVHIAELGYRYMDLREAVGQDFKGELEARGLNRSTIYGYMDVAKFFLEMPESNVLTSGHLKPSQITELVKLPEQEKQALTPEKIAEYGDMSVRALRAEVKQLRLNIDEQDSVQAENQRLKQQLEQTEQDRTEAINMLNHEQHSKSPALKYGVSPTVAHTRERALVLHDLLSQCVGEVGHEVKKCTQSGLDVEQSKECALALYYSLSAPIIHLAKKLEQLVESYGVDVLQAPENMPIFNDEELETAFKLADTLRGAIFVNRKA
ncbi:hypothetical protein [Colwellia psychrerythraea]|uniref:DUF3102 domain-containing protein n=1 Tax=Colwellia psychrerythraea TaxID=28229 RepID=A0A099KNW7_COLPS|nr:hypothetical protein [Colwellia psychrerythraea]KGJ92146.1 hypothetical protein ND2E_3039 [Colwellia psychrerythraea]